VGGGGGLKQSVSDSTRGSNAADRIAQWAYCKIRRNCMASDAAIRGRENAYRAITCRPARSVFRLGQNVDSHRSAPSSLCQFAIDGRHALEFCPGQLNCTREADSPQRLDFSRIRSRSIRFGKQNCGRHVELSQDHLCTAGHSSSGAREPRSWRSRKPGPLATPGHDTSHYWRHLAGTYCASSAYQTGSAKHSRIGVNHDRLELACELFMEFL